MKKILLTITILTLTALAGVLWFSQNNNQTKPSALNIERNKEIEESNKITTKNEDKLQNNQPENNLKEQEEKQSRLTLAQQAEDLGVKLLPNGEIDTGDWKEYRNESCGFVISIPSHWEINRDLDCIKHPNEIPEGIDDTYLKIAFWDPKGPTKEEIENYELTFYDLFIFPFKKEPVSSIEKTLSQKYEKRKNSQSNERTIYSLSLLRKRVLR